MSNLEQTRAHAVELARVLGQLTGRAEWLGKDFTAMLLTRIGQLEALATAEPGSPAAAEIEALRPRLEAALAGLVELVQVAAGGFDSLIDTARVVLDALPKAN